MLKDYAKIYGEKSTIKLKLSSSFSSVMENFCFCSTVQNNVDSSRASFVNSTTSL